MKLPGMNLDQKVLEIFKELVGDRAYQTVALIPGAQYVIEQNLIVAEYPPEVAHDIALHLTDWNSEAAFLVALILFPERFTADEICIGVEQFIIHAPNHIAAAAKLVGWPVTDCFNIGAIDG